MFDADPAALVRDHISFVRSCLRRLGVPEADADDVAQEVFLGACLRIAWFRPPAGADPSDALRAWLHGICVRQAAEDAGRRRRLADRTTDLDELLARASNLPDAETALLGAESKVHVDCALAQLSPRPRAVIELYAIEEVPMRHVARALQIPVSTAWNHLRVARLKLRELLATSLTVRESRAR